jgi:hypothetical protein
MSASWASRPAFGRSRRLITIAILCVACGGGEGPTGNLGNNPRWTHEPDGFVVEVNRSFADPDGSVDDSAGANWFFQPGGSGAVVTNESGEPASSPSALRTSVPSSGNGGGWQGTAALSSPSEWYLGYTFKLDPNWQGHSPDGVLKVVWLGGSPHQLITKADGIHPDVRFQITTEMATPPNGTNNFGSTAINRGQWYKVEVYGRYPATHGGNGTIRVWLNGTEVFNSASVKLTDQGPSEVSVLPYVGGVGGSTAGGRDVFYGHLYFSRHP